MKMEDYIKLLEVKFENQIVFNNDIVREMSWEEIIEDFITYSYDCYDSIIDYVYAITGRNSNCELIEKK